jgi:hypothetical protein
VAKVPAPAIGFTVDTPTAIVHDLGTEFGVHVEEGRRADVQVFNGKVDVQHRSSGQTERLTTGANRRFEKNAVADFDPNRVPPSPPPLAEGVRVVQISSAMGRGKDAYVQPLSPSQNTSDILLLVKNSADRKSGYLRKAYVGLDLAPVQGMRILDAQLSFTYVPTGMGFASECPDATFAVYGLIDESLDGWDDRTLRWDNAPANRAGGAELDASKVVKLGTFQIVQGAAQGVRSISGDALVKFLNQDTNGIVSFIVVRETLGSGRSDLVHGFAGKAHPHLPPPTLKVTVTPQQ